MIVPSDNSTYFSYESPISLSGRDLHGSDIYYTFYDDMVGDILYKGVPFTNCYLRLKSKNETANSSIYPNPFTDELTIQIPWADNDNILLTITDVTGNVLLNVSAQNESELNFNLNAATGKLANGIYMLRATSAIQGVILKSKLIKM